MDNTGNPARFVGDLLFEALRVKNDRLNALVAEVFGTLGRCAVRRLLCEAATREYPPGYRVRLLGAVERVGVVPDINDQTRLFVLLHDQSAQVRDAAARVIVRLQLPVAGGAAGVGGESAGRDAAGRPAKCLRH
jgi:hypothetical protein